MGLHAFSVRENGTGSPACRTRADGIGSCATAAMMAKVTYHLWDFDEFFETVPGTAKQLALSEMAGLFHAR